MAVLAFLEAERLQWKKVGMRPEDIASREEVSKTPEQEPMGEFLKEALVTLED